MTNPNGNEDPPEEQPNTNTENQDNDNTNDSDKSSGINKKYQSILKKSVDNLKRQTGITSEQLKGMSLEQKFEFLERYSKIAPKKQAGKRGGLPQPTGGGSTIPGFRDATIEGNKVHIIDPIKLFSPQKFKNK